MDSKQTKTDRPISDRPANSAGQWFYGAESEPFHMHDLPDRLREAREFDEDELLPKRTTQVAIVHRPIDFLLGSALVLTGIVVSPMVLFPQKPLHWWLAIGLAAWGAHHLFRGIVGVVKPRTDRETDLPAPKE